MGFATRRVLKVSVATMALVLACAASAQTTGGPSTAEPGSDSDRSDASDHGEIIVTAERRSTDLQKTPIAISVFGGQLAQDRDIRDVRDLAGQVPNLFVPRTSISHTTQTFSLRGVGESDPIQEPVLAVYVDDVYIPRQIG